MSTLLTVSDISKHLRVEPETVRRWLRDKKLPSVLLGNRAGRRVTKEAYQQFLDDCELAVKVSAQDRGAATVTTLPITSSYNFNTLDYTFEAKAEGWTAAVGSRTTDTATGWCRAVYVSNDTKYTAMELTGRLTLHDAREMVKCLNYAMEQAQQGFMPAELELAAIKMMCLPPEKAA